MNNAFPPSVLEEFEKIDDLELLKTFNERRRYSRDYYEYSPILAEKLNSCFADIVVKPLSINAVIEVATLCYRHAIPLTLRGAGTGNYGQCVPLEGGVVMLMCSLSKIRSYDQLSGQISVETGCLMGDLNKFLASKGRQLRLLPSTWRTASIGGFIAGGSGGIGSVKWGFLRDPGHLLGLEVVTLQESPQRRLLDSSSSEALNHAYGTNGIITALTLATTPLVSWQEIAIDCESWSDALDLLKSSTNAAIDISLGTLLESQIIKNIPPWSGKYEGAHRLLFLVAPDGVSTLKRLSGEVNANFRNLGTQGDSNGFRELTWNHTTLHMRSQDPHWTYLQMLLPNSEIEAIQTINQKWREDVLWHLEAVRQQGVQRIAALPLVKWKGVELLDELIGDCREVGAIIFNPHVLTVEDGGLGVVDSDQVKTKKMFDPRGILNPGKLRGWL